ncbi:cation diffusion facilitator family transporter [Paenibacillus sp. NPDC058174]|uniref:cation diffusion facilitator family transporter n=1 Tax=Paenibacillus sp. NPDC058174 TaxID=3346366 RepID=UPI0036DCAA0F
MSIKQRYADAETASRSDLWGNAALALFKGIVAILSGSKVLLADAFRSAGQAAAAFAALTGIQLRSSKKAASEDGKGSASRFAAVILPIALVIAGVEIGIAAGKDIWMASEQPLQAPHWSALAAIVAGIVVQQLLLPVRERQWGLLASLTALIGTGSALVGQATGAKSLYYFGPAAAIAISVMLAAGGFRLLAEASRKQHASGVQHEDADDLMQLIQRVEGVITVESLQAKEHGHYVVADVVISVNPRISVLEGHDIAKRVKQLLLLRFTHLTDVTIHVEPYDPGYPYKSNHDPNQEHAPTLLQ